MKNKLIFKIIVTILIVLFTVCMFNNFVYADNFNLEGFEGTASDTIKKPVENILGTIMSVMRIVCTGIAIIIIIAISIKYMTAAPGERADIKKSSIQYVVGAFVLFGSAGIFSIIESAVNGFFQ